MGENAFQNPKNHVSKEKKSKDRHEETPLAKSQVSTVSQGNPSSHFSNSK